MTAKDILFSAACAAMACAISAFAHVLPAPPVAPAPVFVAQSMRTNESPVSVSTAYETVQENGLYRRVRATVVFTNPNGRDLSGDFEFPLPEGASVCGYSLEVGGVMVPGVVVPREKARVAFESEKAKRVDPGIVEHVKGNLWRTRIFPLRPNVPRRAAVDYIEPLPEPAAGLVCEKDGDDVFIGACVQAGEQAPAASSVPGFSRGAIVWDASGSAAGHADAWRGLLEELPEKGDWTLVVFRNTAEKFRFCDRSALLAAVDAVVYDGGTDIAGAIKAAGDGPVLLFSDESDTLGLSVPRYDDMPDVTVASRGPAPRRKVSVRRLAPGEKPPAGVEVRESRLLATAWAADRVRDLAAQAENRRDEFLELGRRYGVASEAASLIVLETLDQYLTHRIEPPERLPFHAEWKRRRAADDDEIAAKKAQAEHDKALLALWEERVKWWKDPVPPRNKPSSGLFDNAPVAAMVGGRERLSRVSASRAQASAPADGAAPAMEAVVACAEERLQRQRASAAASKAEASNPGAAGAGSATVTIAPWNPKAPYLDELGKAADAYAAYLGQKKLHGSAPAFYMDCAGWFFKKGDAALGWRILSNMAEFRLGDAAVWRAMGWRLREAGLLDEAVTCFRHALAIRGEEGQSRRDLALVLSERGRDRKCAKDLSEAMSLLKETAFTPWERRSGRRSNDMQVGVVALEELNAIIAWCAATGVKAEVPALEPAFRRDLPLKVRIVLSWNADETDIDLHVLEPDGEEAYYRNRRTSTGGFVSEDVTTGYGPEEYLRKEGTGVFKVLTNYYASHQTALTGAVTVTATVYTDWGTAAEKRSILTLRLDKPREKHLVGEIRID